MAKKKSKIIKKKGFQGPKPGQGGRPGKHIRIDPDELNRQGSSKVLRRIGIKELRKRKNERAIAKGATKAIAQKKSGTLKIIKSIRVASKPLNTKAPSASQSRKK